MAVIYRTAGAWGAGKGSNLTPAEVDGNFYDHEGRIDALESSPPTPNEIADIVYEDGQITITMADDTAYGPFTIPVAAFNWRGDWTASTLYAYNDVVYVVDYGVYLVMIPHTSPSVFDDEHLVGSTLAYNQIMADLAPPVDKGINNSTDVEYILSLADRGALVRIASEASGNVQVQLPADSVVSWTLGTEITLRQGGSSPLELVFASGITVNAKAGCDYTTVEEGSVVTLVRVSSDEWDYYGDHGFVSV
ncbi:MAG: hypothetical protein ACWGQW_08145, partial [bacterium]